MDVKDVVIVLIVFLRVLSCDDDVLNDIYQDEFIRIEHKTYSGSSDKIILRCCNSNDDLAFKHFARTIQTDIY